MKKAKQIAVVVVLMILAAPLPAAEDDAKARGQFQEILDAINEHSFDAMKPAIDKTDLRNRVYGSRAIENDVRQSFDANFWEMLEAAFLENIPNPGSDARGQLVQFEFQNGKGQAVIRYRLPKYQFVYHVFELRHDKRGRLKIVDWFDTSRGQTFTIGLGEQLLIAMPSKATTRKLLTSANVGNQQLFQVTELLKAARDRQPPRFFEIYDDLDEPLRRQRLIAKFAVNMAILARDADRFVTTLDTFAAVYSGDKDFALFIAESYLQVQYYEKSFPYFEAFHGNFGVREGALPARLSALALAIGRPEDAQKYALEATTREPSLKLGWWSLLRARAADGDFKGSIDALTQLEDNFDERLDAAKLKRDRFRAFSKLADSPEFKEWRDGRD